MEYNKLEFIHEDQLVTYQEVEDYIRIITSSKDLSKYNNKIIRLEEDAFITGMSTDYINIAFDIPILNSVLGYSFKNNETVDISVDDNIIKNHIFYIRIESIYRNINRKYYVDGLLLRMNPKDDDDHKGIIKNQIKIGIRQDEYNN